MNVVTRRPRARWIAARLVWDVLVIILAYQGYRLVRIATQSKKSIALEHSHFLLWWEGQVGLAWEHDIQRLVLAHEWLLSACNLVYTYMFWPIVTGTLLALRIADRAVYARYRNALFLSGGVGLVVFGTYPVAPPRMLDGFVDTVHLFSGAGGVAHPMQYTNAYAAMPSFHVGWLVLAGVASMPALPWARLRPLLLVPGVVMLFVVMATANHYLIDGVVGATLALVALAVVDQSSAVDWPQTRRRLVGPDALVAWSGVVNMVSGHAALAFHRAVVGSARTTDGRGDPSAARIAADQSAPRTVRCHHDGSSTVMRSPSVSASRAAPPAGSSTAKRYGVPGE
jgi:hypothetical protein